MTPGARKARQSDTKVSTIPSSNCSPPKLLFLSLGAIFEKKADWQPFSVVDGGLITGQNPASSTVAAQNVIDLLAGEKAA
jgi:putative intracellular protease/amidase